jgi:hypothetical protein
MNRVLIFIGLKLAEIVGFAAAYFLYVWIGFLLFDHMDDVGRWFGIPAIGMIGTGILGVVGFNWIGANWQKAGELSERWKK